MTPAEYTPVPNIILDEYLRQLKPTEMTVLLVIVRQTLGWMDPRTRRRKHMDWISGSQLQEKTGYSRKAISGALEGLSQKGIIRVTDGHLRILDTPKERQGKTRLYYSLRSVHLLSPDLSPHGKKIQNTWVNISQDVRRKYAQQKKITIGR
jgi:hypothetical protein